MIFKFDLPKIIYMEEKKRSAGKKIAAGALIGTIAGLAAGILLAPKKGKETRENLKKAADRIGKDIGKKVAKMEKLTKIKYDVIVDEVSALYETAKKIKKEDLKEVIDSFKNRWPETSRKVNSKKASRKTSK